MKMVKLSVIRRQGIHFIPNLFTHAFVLVFSLPRLDRTHISYYNTTAEHLFISLIRRF